ncbi:NeuD/PglB/VioB family sugar acetyltransferase [Solibacillus sp. FSL W7-1436]|uniref:NeuD/PglB/VioB family sugar acetyltransferase n=1 Tax=Solibacillus sp. FSL W7-1436 TaxID=2921705 RepID=UPI0030FA89CE
MNNNDIYIIGAGTYGEVMYELAVCMKLNVIGFFDEDVAKHGKYLMGREILGSFSSLDSSTIKNKSFIVAVGNNKSRLSIMESIMENNGNIPTLIHPSANISPSTEIGKGVYIHANVTVWTKASIGDYSILSPNVVIAHHTKVGKACLISTLSSIGASIELGNNVFVGMGSTIMTGISNIGDNTIIGAGAVLVKNAEQDSVYAGVPARKIRKINKN